KSISSFIINTLNGKKEGSNIVEITTSQGKEKDYAIGSSPIDDFEGLMFTFRDITFLKKIREDYIRNESLAAMTTMAAGVAHEIKNPLASISIYLQLIEKEIEDKGSLSKETASLYLPIVSSEVERINTIAVDFLYAVKPMKVNLQQCNLNDIAKITCNLVEGELKEKGINLTLNLASSLPNIFADPSLMEQSILNLIKNAIQAFNEDVLYPSIIVSTFMDGEMAKLSVEDNGCGIAEENIGKIFEPYYTTKPSGSGLGLTVIFKIMKQHGGDITLTSTVGVGSVFTLQIPVPDEERFRIPFKG
ncbi:MAG: histidine kinase, partial [Sphaerochaetaceae bacterium]|nr:histidine kinase [Sphaerochaetaceae bacterium]